MITGIQTATPPHLYYHYRRRRNPGEADIQESPAGMEVLLPHPQGGFGYPLPVNQPARPAGPGQRPGTVRPCGEGGGSHQWCPGSKPDYPDTHFRPDDRLPEKAREKQNAPS